MSQLYREEMFDLPFIPPMDYRMIDHYVLDDGRIWSVAQAKFVTELPEDAVKGVCPDEQGNNSLEGLIAGLEFYGYAKGELENA